MRYFRDRTDAGERLAEAVAALHPADPVVLALPRGGLPVAEPVARRLGAPLDVILVRKIGVPGHEELAAGAVVDGDAPVAVFNPDVLAVLGKSEADFADAKRRKLDEIEARRRRYLGDRAPVPVEGRTAIVVDDGIATGASMRAALQALRVRRPAKIVLAVPVAPADTIGRMRQFVDHVVALELPEPFYAVGAHYHHFDQTSDDTVTAILSRFAGPGGREGDSG